MDANINTQQRFYRRGLVLGFTMAEITVMVIFALLLAVAALLKVREDKIRDMEHVVAGMKGQIRGLEEKIGPPIPQVAGRNQFEDLFRELQPAKGEDAKVKQLKVRIAALLEAALKPVGQQNGAASSGANSSPDGLIPSLNPSGEGHGGISKARTNPLDIPPRQPIGHDQPPIIMLSEAEGYSFETGKADITREFGTAINTQIIPLLKELAHKYMCDVIEVIGHTDGQPVASMKSNLDANLTRLVNGELLALTPGSNADLGLMRAWSVIRYLQEAGGLQGMAFYGYGAGQVIRPDGHYAASRDAAVDASRRRIEIRLRRSLSSPRH
jgi:outer membrane protein OmpA-like peptidoglycan-associated protein